MKTKVYPAKIDLWLWPVLAGASLGLIAWGGAIWESDHAESILLMGSGLFMTVLISLFLFPCHYTIAHSEVLIRSGILRYQVPIEQIRTVQPTSNPMSAPAPSLKRVEIRMENGKYYLVSPKDREGFIEELRTRMAGTS